MEKSSFWTRHLLKLGLLAAVGYWLVEAYNDTFIFGVGSFYRSFIWPPGHELWTRAVITGFLIFISWLIQKEMTKRQNAETALKTNLEKIKLFAYQMSHDMKNPVEGILGMVKLIEKNCQEEMSKKSRLYFSSIRASARQISELAEDINTFIKTREFPLRLEIIKLGEICEILKEEYAAPARNRGINLVFPDVNAELKADRTAILRALRNLIDNSFKYGGKNIRQIIISHEQNDRSHLLVVKDDGQGFNCQDIGKIFEPFKRSVESDIGGTGLGLSIVKEIVEKHGGKVWVDTNNGQGAKFVLSLAKDLDISKQLMA